MADFAREASRRPLEQESAGPGPHHRKDVKLDKGNILNLCPEAVDDFEAGLGAAVGLRLVKGFLGDFLGEDGGRLGLLQDSILAEGEEGFEEILADGEAEDELLPREERAVQEAGEALLGQTSGQHASLEKGVDWEGAVGKRGCRGTYLKEIHAGDGECEIARRPDVFAGRRDFG